MPNERRGGLRLRCCGGDGMNAVVTIIHNTILTGGNRRRGGIGWRCRFAADAELAGAVANSRPPRGRLCQPVYAQCCLSGPTRPQVCAQRDVGGGGGVDVRGRLGGDRAG